jgi:signal peptidase I
MAPTFQPGDRLLVLRCWPRKRLRKGLVILLKPTPELLNSYALKRIAGLAGDVIDAVDTGTDAHAEGTWRCWRGTVPANHIYVVGDDPSSLDSSGFGPLSMRFLDGVVISRLPSKDLRFTRPA